jgi:hypothetical protein
MAPKSNPYKIDGVKRRNSKPIPWLTAFFAVSSFVLGVTILTPIPEKIRRRLGLGGKSTPSKQAKQPEPEVIYKDRVVEKEVKVRPPYYQVEKGTDVSKTSRGFDYRYQVQEKAGRLASDEKAKDGTYEASLTFSVVRPEAAKRFDELVRQSPDLPKILPGLESLMERPRVSPFFKNLYDNKRDRMKLYANRFDRVLTKHNYFDCQTMLELEHPGSKRKVFLFQADMDVVSDGSDGDRLPTMPDKIVNSAYYQPFTSYGWKKTGAVENPMIAGWRKMLAEAKAKGNSSEVKRLTDGIKDLERRSFLIAEYDPFIVIPVYILQDRESAWGPNVGDYVAVIYGKKVYPAIVGDGGPSFKLGEASLRMAKELNPRSSSYSRPVSDLKVTYIVFPRSSGDWQAPDYSSWKTECAKLLDEIGGLGEGYQLHEWTNTLPKIGDGTE